MKIDLRAKFKIASRIEEVLVNENGVETYAHGWSDARIARELGVDVSNVRAVRKSAFKHVKVVRGGGPGRPARSATLRNDITALEARISALESMLISNRAA
jgi:DNA-binding NarL/FixJ family response regulator